MTKRVVGSKILKKEQVLISFFLIAILVLSSGSMVAFAKTNIHVVTPNGVDDTADIRAALNACVGAGPWCTVQLVKGTYTISSQITVYGFQGSFVGAGQGQTNIVALGGMPSPNPAYNIPCAGYPTCTSITGDPASGVPYWVGYPGMGPDGSGSPEGSGTPNPWPALFTFEGGSTAISGMTITDTSPTPTLGYYVPAIDGGALHTALAAAILITGPGASATASATIDHVSIVGTAGDWFGYNIACAVYISGRTLPSGWSSAEADPMLLTGTFSITNNVFDDVQSGIQVNFLVNANVLISGNTVSSAGVPTAAFYPFYVFDLSNTNVLISRNQGTVPNGIAITVYQSILKSGLLPSMVTIMGNNFQVTGGANAVVLQDAGFYNYGTPVTLSAIVLGNTFQNSYAGASAWYYSAILSITLKSSIVSLNNVAGGGSDGIYINGGPATVAGNTIAGAATGVWLDMASGGHVAGNVITNSIQYGISVTSTNAAFSSATTPSSNNVIARNFVHNSGSYDLYWDVLGTGNGWCHNVYKTSSPSVLPSC